MTGNAVETHDVVIVGAGPAGLAAARQLIERGITDVVVLEREREAGGIPRHCHHTGYGLREFGRLMKGPAFARRTVAAAERASGLWEYRQQKATQAGAHLRTLIVVVAAAIGLLALIQWAPPDQLTFYWLGLAMGAMVLGLVFRESRYRWVGIVLYFSTAVRFGLNDLRNLQPLLRFTILAALVASGLVLAWAYSEFR